MCCSSWHGLPIRNTPLLLGGGGLTRPGPGRPGHLPRPYNLIFYLNFTLDLVFVRCNKEDNKVKSEVIKDYVLQTA